MERPSLDPEPDLARRGAGPGPALRRRGHDVVRRARVARARPPRRRRVRAPGHRRQAGAAGGVTSTAATSSTPSACSARPGDVAARRRRGPTTPSPRDVLRRAEPWGVTSIWLGAGPRPPAGRGRPRALDRRRRPGGGRARRPTRAALPPAVGAHPRRVRAPRACSPAEQCLLATTSASPAPTKGASPRCSTPPSPTVAPTWSPAGREEAVDVTLVGPVWSRRPRARPRRRGHRTARGGDRGERRADRLPVPLHRGRRARRRLRCSPTSPARHAAKMAESRRSAPTTRRVCSTPCSNAPAIAMADTLRRGRSALHVRQRRQRHRRRGRGRPVPRAAQRSGDPGGVARRTIVRCSPRWPTTSASSSCSRASSSPTPARGDVALGLLDQRRLRQRAAGLRRGARARAAHDRAGGYEGGAMAASADVDHCLVVPSDSVHRIQESAGRAGPRSVGSGAGPAAEEDGHD